MTPTPLARDRYGRPLVIPPGGGKPVAYTRCTTFVSALEDTTALTKWKMRQVALGLATRSDLYAMVSASADDKNALNRVCEDAMEAAKSSAAANTGTAIHKFCELVDAGAQVQSVPADHRADVEAYLRATANLTHEHSETFMVQDDLKVGGTPDRLSRTPDGRLVVVDIKTGSVEYGMGKIAQQLAMYSRSRLYDPDTGERRDLDIHQAVGYVVHVPAGTGRSSVHIVDLNAGWEGVLMSAQVREWRKRKNLSSLEADLTPPLPDTLDALRALWASTPSRRGEIEAKVAAMGGGA